MANIICGAQMVEEMGSLQISHIKLKETFERHEKLLTEILRRLESLRTVEKSIWKISQADHPAVEREIQIGQPNLTLLVEFSPTHHRYIDHPDHSSYEEDLRMEEVEDGFLSLVEVAKAATNKRKMDDVAAVGQNEGSYTAAVRGSKSLPWQQQTTLDTASKLKITMPSDAAYDNSFSKSLCNRIARFSAHLMKRIQSSYQFLIGRETMKHFFQIVCGSLCSSNLMSIRSQGYPIVFYLGGEWECPQWNFFNYGRNVVCLRCDSKRPGETPFGASGPVFGLAMVKL